MIHNTAIIDPSAKLGENVSIGPWSFIGPDVEIGDNTSIGPHVVIKCNTKIGRNNKIYQFCSLGDDPQAKIYAGEKTVLEIGNDNIIREFCTVHRATEQGGGITRIGSRNFLMAYVHVAHDCKVGDDIIFANNAALSGHVTVGNYANLGGYSAVHQFCVIGEYCFIAGATSVPKDVPPYILVSGHPASIYGLNLVGLKRNGFSDESVGALRRAYNIIYRQGYTVQQAVERLEMMLPEHPEVQNLITALNNSKRGIVR